MPWSIFSQGGGPGAALTWARDLLGRLGVPDTPANEQFVYDWEVSEGGGGKYNPLNQGPVPGQPQLTTTGPQYGGGAADFASYSAGLTGAEDYLQMPAYAGVLGGLQNNDAAAARQALWTSDWAASHYGYGTGWSSAALPGKTAPLSGGSSAGAPAAGAPLPGVTWYEPWTWGNAGGYFARYGGIAAGVAAGSVLLVMGVKRATGARTLNPVTVVQDRAAPAAAAAAAAA